MSRFISLDQRVGPCPLQASTTPALPQGLVEPVFPVSEAQAASQKRRRSTSERLPSGASVPPSMGLPVIGVIDGKFEYGYLVTVTVGNEKLQGVLYHTPEYPVTQVPQYSGIANNIGNETAMSGSRRRRRRKKSEMRKRDPSHPKPNRSGYNFFFAEQHARLKPLHPGRDREISKMIGDLWNKLTETEKSVYQERGIKDKERYKSEMEEYRERLKASMIIRNAVPLRQRPALPEDAAFEMDLKAEKEEGGLVETSGNASSSEESDSEDMKLVDKDSDVEGFLPEAGTTVESVNQVGDPQVDGDASELRSNVGGGDNASQSMKDCGTN